MSSHNRLCSVRNTDLVVDATKSIHPFTPAKLTVNARCMVNPTNHILHGTASSLVMVVMSYSLQIVALYCIHVELCTHPDSDSITVVCKSKSLQLKFFAEYKFHPAQLPGDKQKVKLFTRQNFHLYIMLYMHCSNCACHCLVAGSGK